MLTFPAKAPDAGTAPRFEHGNHNGGTAHPRRLLVSNRKQSAIRNGLYEAVAKGICRDTETPDRIRGGDLLDDIRISSARVDKSSAQGFKELTVFCTPGSQLRYLAGASCDDVLVALSTALCVIGGTEAILNRLNLLENETVIVKRPERYDIVRIQCFERSPLLSEAVGQVVKTSRRLRRVAFRVTNDGAIFVFHHAVMTESISAVLAVCLREYVLTLQNEKPD